MRPGIEVTPRAFARGSNGGNLRKPTTEEAIVDVVRTPDWAAPTSRSAKPEWRAFALSIDCVALYLALDRLSFIGGLHRISITPWNPSAGLAMALLIITSRARKQCSRRSTSKQGSSPVRQWSWLTRFRSARPAEPATECDGGDGSDQHRTMIDHHRDPAHCQARDRGLCRRFTARGRAEMSETIFKPFKMTKSLGLRMGLSIAARSSSFTAAACGWPETFAPARYLSSICRR